MQDFLEFSEKLISGMLPFVFLVFSGIYLSVKSGFFQVRLLPRALKRAFGGMFGGKSKNGGISPFQAACTALSATVGTGNITGVAGAVSIGGAGAVFWMWIAALAGMIVKVFEIVLSVDYRQTKRGKPVGGPMYYIKKGLPRASGLAAVFAGAGIFAVFFSGNLTQSNAAAGTLGEGFGVRLGAGAVFALFCAAVIVGGARRIGVFTEKIVPIMALLYIAMSSGVIFLNSERIPEVFGMIIKGAFNPAAVTGGAVGSFMTAVMTGASRGVFSNEAGLGTSAMVYAATDEKDGIGQSLYGIFEVFTDTIVICTLTALTILCGGVNIEYGRNASTELVSLTLSEVYGGVSSALLCVMMCLFAVSSTVGWGFYGIVCTGYLFGEKGERVFVFLYPLFCIIGAVCPAETAWRLSAFFNGIMLCVNTAAVLFLSDGAALRLRCFERKNKEKRGKKIDKGKNTAFAE